MTIANVIFSKETAVSLSSQLYILYDYLIPPLAKRIKGDFANKAEANLMCEYISLLELNKDDF